MSFKRRHSRPDENQEEIVKALRKAGVLVAVIGRPVDLLTYHGGHFLPLEIKRPKARPRKDQEAQKLFLDMTGCPVIQTVQEALNAVLGHR